MSARTKFRSKFEKTIADYLTKKGIKFEYETKKSKYRKPIAAGICNVCGKVIVTGKQIGRAHV